MAFGILLCLGGSASAAIYWGATGPIARANMDGSYLLDGGGPGRQYIGYQGSSSVAEACGIAVNATHIYWTDPWHNVIGRANLDGSNPEYSFITGTTKPCGIAVSQSHVFWANTGDFREKTGTTIGRANLSGGAVDQGFIQGLDSPCGLAVDDSHVFWARFGEKGGIGRANIDGSSVEPEFINGPVGTCGVALSPTHIYWGSYGSSIGRANLDGTTPVFDFIPGLSKPCGVAVNESHLYWIERSSRQIGRANLDGSDIAKGIVPGLADSCGIAVDALSFSPPPPPPPQESVCDFGELRRNSHKGTAAIRLMAPIQGSLRVLTKGLNWRVLTKEAPPWVGGWWPWWVKVWPGSKGRRAEAIRGRLRDTGRAKVKLRIECQGDGELPGTMTKEIALHRIKRQSKAQGSPEAPGKGRSPQRLFSTSSQVSMTSWFWR